MVVMMQAHFDVVAIIREPARHQRERCRRERRWKDYFYSVYHQLRRQALGLHAWRRAYFHDVPHVPAERLCPQYTTSNINDPEPCRLVGEAHPDLTIVMGTSILKRDMLAATGPNTINIHGGFLPHYRGNHCFFFALYQRDFDKIGSTIHFIDRGIDTGDIIEIVVPPIEATDNAEKLYCKAERLAIHRLVAIIQNFGPTGNFPRQRQPFRGKLYCTRDRNPWHELHHWIRCITGAHSRAFEKWASGSGGRDFDVRNGGSA